MQPLSIIVTGDLKPGVLSRLSRTVAEGPRSSPILQPSALADRFKLGTRNKVKRLRSLANLACIAQNVIQFYYLMCCAFGSGVVCRLCHRAVFLSPVSTFRSSTVGTTPLETFLCAALRTWIFGSRPLLNGQDRRVRSAIRPEWVCT